MSAVPMPRDLLAPVAFAAIGMAVLGLGWRDWQRLAALPPVLPAPAETQIEAAAAPAPGAARATLARLPLFGAPDEPVAAAPPPPPAPVIDEATLPDSTAGYQLFGIIEAEVQSAARAILGAADGEQREYRVGDAMPDGARVHAVRERAVIFERDGRLERLSLPVPMLESTAAGGTVPMPGRLPGAADFNPDSMYGAPDVDPAALAPIAPMEPTEVPPPPGPAGTQ